MHTGEPRVPEPSSFETEIDIKADKTNCHVLIKF